MHVATKQKFAELYYFLIEESEDGIWLSQLGEPLPTNLKWEDQAEHLFKYAYLAECNKAFARMYGYSNPDDLVGARFSQHLLLSDPANLKAIRTFLSSNYKIKNVETHERDRYNRDKYFLNDVYGVIEQNHLVRVWGRQRDITSKRVHQLSFNHLTPFQLSILKLTIHGRTLGEISRVHNVTEKTVDTVRTRLKKKFGAKTIPELAARVALLGLFDLDELSQTDQLGLFANPPR